MKKYVIFYYEKNHGKKSREVGYILSAENEKSAASEFEDRVVSGEIDNFDIEHDYKVEALYMTIKLRLFKHVIKLDLFINKKSV